MQNANRGEAVVLIERSPAGIMSKIRYWRDKHIASSGNQVWLLVFAAMAQILLSACAFYIAGEDNLQGLLDSDSGFPAYIWAGYLVLTDPGSMSMTGGIARPVAALFGLCGIFFFAVVLGFIVDAIRENLDAIKKGRCNVVEKDHLLILGWTDACYLLLREVALALEDTEAVVVILCTIESEQRKEMLKRIHDVLPLRNLHVIVRNGFPGNITDLMTVAVGHARTVIVPAPQGDATEADNSVLNITMALKATQLAPGAHIVAELRDVDDEDMVGLLGGGEVVTMVSHDMVGRLMTMAARQPGLADIFAMLLGFAGDEFYLKRWDELTGMTFGELPELFPDAIVCGYLDSKQKVRINPPLEYVMAPGDELLVIAETFESYYPRQPNLKNMGGRTSVFSKRDAGYRRRSSLGMGRTHPQQLALGTRNNLFTEPTSPPPQNSVSAPKSASATIHVDVEEAEKLNVPSERRTSFLTNGQRGFSTRRLSTQSANNVTAHVIEEETYKTFCSRNLEGQSARRSNIKEKFLIIGMRRDLRDILRSMNEISFQGTQVHLFNELTREEQIESLEETGDFQLHLLSHLEIHHHTGNPVSR
jgi:hypothetical protein